MILSNKALLIIYQSLSIFISEYFKDEFLMKKYFIIAIITFLVILYFLVPKSCQLDIKNYFNISDTCKRDLRIFLIRKIKSNKFIYDQSYESLRNFYFSSNYFREETKLIKLFNDKDLSYVKNQIYQPKKVKRVEGILSGAEEKSKHFKNFNINNNELDLEWNRSHGGNSNLKFSNNDYINFHNISDLKLIWKFSSINKENLSKEFKANIEANPIYLNGKIIAIFADYSLVAIDPENGNEIWKIKNNLGPPTSRGILGYLDLEKNEEFVFVSFGNRLFKYNAKNGKVIKQFGRDGFVEVNTRVAPAIYENNLIISNLNSILFFDKNSGKKIGEISIHNYEKNFLDGNIWGGVALDSNNGILLVSTGNPSPAAYGVKRPGKNERSNSVIAIDVRSRSIIWSFQETAHDLWDFDISSPPIIHDLKINNIFYEVVIVTTKVGNTLILERKTGRPIFDIFYSEAPRSDVPGEYSEPYQLLIKIPESFSKIDYSEKDFSNLDENKKYEIKKKLYNSKYGWYEPPSFNKDLITFGLHGGAQWQGASLDPLKQYLYIPVNNVPWRIRPFFVSSEKSPKISDDFIDAIKIYNDKCSSCHGDTRNGKYKKKGEKLEEFVPSLVGNKFRNEEYNSKFFSESMLNYLHPNLNVSDFEVKKLADYFKWWDNQLEKKNEIFVEGGYKSWSQFLTSDNLPGSNPPWGYIAKLDLVTGKILYKIPIGYKIINGKKEKIGTTIFGGVSSNKAGIVFATGTEDSLAYAIDGENGKELWNYQMDAAGSAPPLIYVHKNKQYVSFLSTGGGYHNYKEKNSTLYTFTIIK